MIYIVGGTVDGKVHTASIERLNVLNGATAWETLHLPEMTARTGAMVSPLNEDTFLIAGGAQEETLLKDAIVVRVSEEGLSGFVAKTGTMEHDLGFRVRGGTVNMLPLLPGQVIGIAGEGKIVVKFDMLG